MKLLALAVAALLPCIAASPDVDKNKTVGNPNAPLMFELYSDFMCPHCKVMHETILPSIVQDYVKSKKRNNPGTGDPDVLNFLQSCEARAGLQETLADVYDLELLEAAKERVQLRVSMRDWKIYQDLACDGRPVGAVAEEHHLTAQALLMVKSRVKKKLREEIQRLEKPVAEPREG